MENQETPEKKESHYFTVLVRNLPGSATKSQVKEHFEKSLPGCEPIVHDLVPDGNRKGTTVTLITKRKFDQEIAIETLKNASFGSEAEHQSKLVIDDAFRGLNLLACSTDEPEFDFYFIHGLTGHGYNTWLHRSNTHKSACMWPRDVLPSYLQNHNNYRENAARDAPQDDQNVPNAAKHLSGRYFTFGYNAELFKWDNMSQTIEAAARYLIQCLAREDNMLPDKPKYFVCHSLGGLVLTQAMVFILSKKQNPDDDDSYPSKSIMQFFFHSETGDCLVKGIFYFGTPFGGSRLANFASSVTAIMRRNASFADSLRPNSKEVKQLRNSFKLLRKHEKCSIPLVIFYEEKKMGRGIAQFEVTTWHSALSGFDGTVRDIPIPRDHSRMIKFSSETDTDFYNTVGKEILAIVSEAITGISMDLQATIQNLNQATQVPQNRPMMTYGPIILINNPFAIGATSSYRWVTRATADSLAQIWGDAPADAKTISKADNELISLSQFEWNNKALFDSILGWIMSGLENENLEKSLSNQLDDVQDPISTTCDWLLDNDQYRCWENEMSPAFLFIEGAEGFGKSVLAKYVVVQLKNRKENSIIAFFFCKGIRKQGGAIGLLRRIILQIEEQDPGILRKVIKTLNFDSFSKKQDFDMLWNLFKAITYETKKKIYCVIDGIDEIVTSLSPQNTSPFVEQNQGNLPESEVAKFLKQLRNHFLSIQSSTDQTDTSTTEKCKAALLMTSRPLIDITDSFKDETANIFIDIPIAEVQQRAKSVIESQIRDIVLEEHLGTELEALIRRVLFHNTGESSSPFQWASMALKKMKSYKSESSEFLKDRLDEFRPDIYSLYRDTLDSLAKTEMQEIASSLFTILITVQEDIPFDAVADLFNFTLSKLNFNTQKLQSTIDKCQGLVRVTNSGVIQFDHKTVKDFLLQLSGHPAFKYDDLEVEHCIMTTSCIYYLLVFIGRDISAEELHECEGDRLFAAWSKSPFLWYALLYWPYHVLESGFKISGLDSLMKVFLKDDCLGFNLSQVAHHYAVKEEDDSITQRILPPTWFLAGWDMFVPLVMLTDDNPTLFTRFIRKLTRDKNFSTKLKLTERDSEGSTILHWAAENGSIHTVAYLIELGAKGNVFNNANNTPFSLAVQYNHVDVAKLLISKAQAADGKFQPGSITSLHYAVSGSMDIVLEYLLSQNPDLERTALSAGWTPIHIAAETGREDIFKALISRRANIEAKQTNGRTALHIAASNGHMGIIRLLFATKPDLNPAPRLTSGITPLYQAASSGFTEVFSFLQSKCAHVEPTDEGILPIHVAATNGHADIISLIPSEGNINAQTNIERRPIHFAAISGHLEIIKSLAIRDADLDAAAIDLRSSTDNPIRCVTPLYLCIVNGHLDLVMYFLEQNVQVKSWRGFNNDTLVHVAAEVGQSKIMETLVKDHNLDLFARGKDGQTALHMAASNGKYSMLEYIINAGFLEAIEVDTLDAYQYSALHYAITSGNTESVEILIKNGANTNLVGGNGVYPILMAAQVGNEQILKALLEKDTKLDVQGYFACTPLGEAAKTGKTTNVELLVAKNIDIDFADDMGLTPLQEATARGHIECVEYLINRGASLKKYNVLGLNALDYSRKNSLFRSVPEIERSMIDYEPLPTEMRHKLIKKALSKHLHSELLTDSNLKSESFMNSYAMWLGWLLFGLGRFKDVGICYEQLGRRYFNGTGSMSLRCDKCYQHDRKTPFHRCETCLIYTECNECHEKRKEEDTENQLKECSKDHKFLVICGEEWQNLKPGTVNKEGQSFQDWLNDRKEEFPIQDFT